MMKRQWARLFEYLKRMLGIYDILESNKQNRELIEANREAINLAVQRLIDFGNESKDSIIEGVVGSKKKVIESHRETVQTATQQLLEAVREPKPIRIEYTEVPTNGAVVCRQCGKHVVRFQMVDNKPVCVNCVRVLNRKA